MRFASFELEKMCCHPERKREKNLDPLHFFVKQTVVWLKFAQEKISLFVFEYVKKAREH